MNNKAVEEGDAEKKRFCICCGRLSTKLPVFLPTHLKKNNIKDCCKSNDDCLCMQIVILYTTIL